MRQGQRARFDRATAAARESAYPPGEYVGQESFMGAGEIRALAERAGVGPGVSVLDICCGVAGPGREVARSFGPHYLGVDGDADAVELARARATGLDCAFMVGTVPPLPPGPFDVVMLLETVLAFPDKDALVRGVAAVLRPGGRFAFTLEAGSPLTVRERGQMPGADTVHLVPLPDMVRRLERAGLRTQWHAECTAAHAAVAGSLCHAYERCAAEMTAEIGGRAVDQLLEAHRLWWSWLSSGRVRKFAVVAERCDDGPSEPF